MAEPKLIQDTDRQETQEWLDALDDVYRHGGAERIQFMLRQLMYRARGVQGVFDPAWFNTPYINTIFSEDEPVYPGDLAIESQISNIIRWNAMAMVVRTGKTAPDVGGHIASYASAESLYEVGFQHFFRAPSEVHGGDLVYIQGHSSPGIYARAFLEGRLSEQQLLNFRQEVGGQGLPSYPHPMLMPDFWQFATVSMGLGPLMAIYQARFLKYLQARGLADTSNRKVWVFCGDGEMDEPESKGAIDLACREGLDNLIFVVNCNLQRLDGPVRGNGKIIQELERQFSGCGWQVLKVLWGSDWDDLFKQGNSHALEHALRSTVDGEFQNFVVHSGYMREFLLQKAPELETLFSNYSDQQLQTLSRGGHDRTKIFAAYQRAVNTTGQPTVILAHTIKGYGMGEFGEALNTTHQTKKLNQDGLLAFRDRFEIPLTDKQVEKVEFVRFEKDSKENQYLQDRRAELGGYLPQRRAKTSVSLTTTEQDKFASVLKDSGEREYSTTMAFVRVLNTLLKDKSLKPHLVPIVPDESRTFGMEGLFRQIGIYAPEGQLYKPVDDSQIMCYREKDSGQILQEGLNEAGATASWIAAGTSYSVSDVPMIPFYIYYSMFGFQRVGDFLWAAGDMQTRGFLIGATAGRTTLAGEGLQHTDGHSHLMAATIPNCVSYDPTFGYELAVIIRHGLKRMVEQQDNIFFYITVMNENYHHPELPKDSEEGIVKGLYCFKKSKLKNTQKQVQLLGSGTILREALKAAEILETKFKIKATVWSATSFTELAREKNYTHLKSCLGNAKGPVIAATDYMRAYPEQIRAGLTQTYLTLGTDGFGLSDTREALRRHFKVDALSIIEQALHGLFLEGEISEAELKKAHQTMEAL